ncbi:hypothetical protein H1P_1100023 [Hyella patelloides LEGE 07179]|uniref:Uncharacterized protein n=1 Tax=Hyella patelloides LEGE 07179 TaxID=945734 RepID=A0A563VJN3_9CYAN|nr:hypothetical protein H1P_1100023 [Hyella patelloides LEGE 07179]
MLSQRLSLTDWFNKLRYYFIVEIKNQAIEQGVLISDGEL